MGKADEIIDALKRVNTNPKMRFYNGTLLTKEQLMNVEHNFRSIDLIVVIDFTPENRKFLINPENEGGTILYTHVEKRNSICVGFKKDVNPMKLAKVYFMKEFIDKECSICCNEITGKYDEIMAYCTLCYYNACVDCLKTVNKCPNCRKNVSFECFDGDDETTNGSIRIRKNDKQ
jgi:hypothetical protein